MNGKKGVEITVDSPTISSDQSELTVAQINQMITFHTSCIAHVLRSFILKNGIEEK